MKLKTSGEAEFCFYAPKICNAVPINTSQAPPVNVVKKQLKTYFFTLVFDWWSGEVFWEMESGGWAVVKVGREGSVTFFYTFIWFFFNCNY